MSEKCSLLEIVKNNIDDIFEVLRRNIPGYDLIEKTKCLNTAVIVATLYLGTEASSIIEECSVPIVSKRNVEIKELHKKQNVKKEINLNAILVKQCIDEMFAKNQERCLFYVMITDAEVQHKHQKMESRVFPGHVFVVEKMADESYNLYQSYISNYDLSGHFERNLHTFQLDKNRLLRFMKQVQKLYKHGIWTPSMTKAWLDITFVDESQLNNYVFKDASYFCYRSVPLTTCLENLDTFVKTLSGYEKLKADINQILNP